MTDRTIVLDPSNPLPLRVFDNGDGTYSLAIYDPTAPTSNPIVVAEHWVSLTNGPSYVEVDDNGALYIYGQDSSGELGGVTIGGAAGATANIGNNRGPDIRILAGSGGYVWISANGMTGALLNLAADGSVTLATPQVGDSRAGTLKIDANGNLIFSSLPSADPALANALWSDGGLVKVSGANPVEVRHESFPPGHFLVKTDLTDPDFWIDGPEGQSVTADWGDTTSSTATLLAPTPGDPWGTTSELTHHYTDGKIFHHVVITTSDFSTLDLFGAFMGAGSRSFPSPIQLTGVVDLEASGFRGADLDAVVVLSNLETVYLANLSLTSPPDVTGLTALKKLYVIQNPQLRAAPTVSSLTSLEELHLWSNQLATLPDLSPLTALKFLTCYSNRLTSLPSLESQTQLIQLICDHNRLTALPTLNSSQLSILYCHNNQLTELPDLSVATALTNLSCGVNQLTALPDLSALVNLQNLHCSFNQLTELPDLSTTVLEILRCEANHLTALPDFSTVTTASALHCGDNLLTEVSVNSALAQCVVMEASVSGPRTLELGSAGNAAPTGQGLLDKATLIAAGWTVDTN